MLHPFIKPSHVGFYFDVTISTDSLVTINFILPTRIVGITENPCSLISRYACQRGFCRPQSVSQPPVPRPEVEKHG